MIKSIIYTALMAGSITYNVTDSFDVVKNAANRVVSVYEAASYLSPFKQSPEEYRVAQANLYKASANIQPLAGMVHDVKSVSIEDGRDIFYSMRDI